VRHHSRRFGRRTVVMLAGLAGFGLLASSASALSGRGSVAAVAVSSGAPNSATMTFTQSGPTTTDPSEVAPAATSATMTFTKTSAAGPAAAEEIVCTASIDNPHASKSANYKEAIVQSTVSCDFLVSSISITTSIWYSGIKKNTKTSTAPIPQTFTNTVATTCNNGKYQGTGSATVKPPVGFTPLSETAQLASPVVNVTNCA
jgi:hypothetical protein